MHDEHWKNVMLHYLVRKWWWRQGPAAVLPKELTPGGWRRIAANAYRAKTTRRSPEKVLWLRPLTRNSRPSSDAFRESTWTLVESETPVRAKNRARSRLLSDCWNSGGRSATLLLLREENVMRMREKREILRDPAGCCGRTRSLSAI